MKATLPPRYPSTGAPNYGGEGNSSSKISLVDKKRNDVARAKSFRLLPAHRGPPVSDSDMSWKDFSPFCTESGAIPKKARVTAVDAQKKFKQRNLFASHFGRIVGKEAATDEQVTSSLEAIAKELEGKAGKFGMSIISQEEQTRSKPSRPQSAKQRTSSRTARVSLKLRTAQSFIRPQSASVRPDSNEQTNNQADATTSHESQHILNKTIQRQLEKYLNEPAETPEEKWMNQVWLQKRLKDVQEARRTLEVQHALDQWAISRGKLEEEISHRQQVRRFIHRPMSAKPVRSGLNVMRNATGSRGSTKDNSNAWVPHPIVLERYAYSIPSTRPSSALPQRTTSADLTAQHSAQDSSINNGTTPLKDAAEDTTINHDLSSGAVDANQEGKLNLVQDSKVQDGQEPKAQDGQELKAQDGQEPKVQNDQDSTNEKDVDSATKTVLVDSDDSNENHAHAAEVPVALPRQRVLRTGRTAQNQPFYEGDLLANLVNASEELDPDFELRVHREEWASRKVTVETKQTLDADLEDWSVAVVEDTSEFPEDDVLHNVPVVLDAKTATRTSLIRPASAMPNREEGETGSVDRQTRPVSAPVRVLMRSEQPNLLFQAMIRHKAALRFAERQNEQAKANTSGAAQQDTSTTTTKQKGKNAKGGKKTKGKPKKGKSKRGSKKNSSSASQVTPSYPASAFLPVDPPPAWLMSETRKEQLIECERIRARFAAKGLSLNCEALERALVVPEDRPDSFCTEYLPPPGAKLEVNPLLSEKQTIFGKGGKPSKIGSPKRKVKGKAKGKKTGAKKTGTKKKKKKK